MALKKILELNKRIFTAMLLIAIAVIGLVFWFGLQIKHNQEVSIQSKLNISISQNTQTFTDVIDHTGFLMQMMNQQIAKNPKDNSYVYSILSRYKVDPSAANRIPWTYFDWIDENSIVQVNAAHGYIGDKKISAAHRDYVPLAKRAPDHLHFSKPDIGVTSGRWLLPIGMGARDSNGFYIGANIVGIDLNTMANQLKSMRKNENINFYILDRNLNLLIDSSKAIQGPKNTVPSTISNVVATYASSLKDEAEFNIDILGNENNYLLKKLDDLPFYIYVQYDSAAIKADFWQSITSRLIELAVIGFIAIAIAIYIYRRESGLRKKAEESFQMALSASKGKTEFLAYTGHELRSPLNVIIFGSEMMKSKIFGDMPPKYLEYAEDIYQNGNDLLHFIEDLMDVTKADAEGSFSLSPSMVKVEEIIDRVIKLNITRATKHKVRIEKIIAADLPDLWADSRRLRQILNNLISNAIKYSPENTTVHIIAHSIDGILQILVEDEGFGMTPGQIDIALSKYGTIKNDNSDKVDSIGLGLPLVHQLMKAHNAKFDIESAPNKGTSVTLTFKLGEKLNAKIA